MIRFITALAATAIALAGPAQAEVIKLDSDGFVTRDTAEVSADLQTTWLELITPGNWWNDAHTWSADASNLMLTPQGGGCFCERIPPQEEDGAIGLAGSVQHMVVLQAFPRKALRMRGGLGPLQSEPVDGVLTVTLKETDNGTRILWEYVVGGYMRYKAEDISKAVDGVMTQQLNGLAAKLGRLDEPEAPPEEAQVEEESEDSAPAEEESAGAGNESASTEDTSEGAIGDDFLEGVEGDGTADPQSRF